MKPQIRYFCHMTNIFELFKSEILKGSSLSLGLTSFLANYGRQYFLIKLRGCGDKILRLSIQFLKDTNVRLHETDRVSSLLGGVRQSGPFHTGPL